MRAIALSLSILVAVSGCSAGTQSDGFFTGGAGGGSESTADSFSTANGFSTGTTSFSTGDAGTGGSSSGCSSAAQLVYVFSTDNEILSFDPPTKKFTPVASPDCNSSGTPNSMAIDRNLVAWLNYTDGYIYKFDLNTKSGCQQVMSLPDGYTQVGMGFSTDTSDGTAETLYVDGINGGGLAKIDTSTNSLTQIGQFNNDNFLSGESCELTGTGNAKLFGYFTTDPSRVAEINKTDGSIISDKNLQLTPPQDWAFSFWGGDFYLYASDGFSDSSVIHYSPGNGSVDPEYISDVGFTIIGAGVSTCAPIVPPQ